MPIRTLTKLTCLAVVGSVFVSAIAFANPKPNIVMILVDDLGWTDLSCQGSRFYETPNIDRLAADGIRFTNAYAASAVCSPTRAAILTGRYPHRIGATDWFRMSFQPERKADPKLPNGYTWMGPGSLITPRNPRRLEHDQVTIAELLHGVGYQTGHVGKWHLGGSTHGPLSQGFASNFAGCDLGLPPSYFDPYKNGSWGKQGIPGVTPRATGEYLTDRESEAAVNFIRSNADKPFFLYMAHYAVHTPVQAKRELVDRYKAKPKSKHDNPVYAAMIHSVDQAVGRIVATLERQGIAYKTVVIFTSDNGGELRSTSNWPLREGKGFAYEGGLRVPLIIRRPGMIEPGSVSHEPVISMDLFSTIAEMAGVRATQDGSMDGISLVDHVNSSGESKLGPRHLVWHFPHYRNAGPGPYSVIRSGDWKLIKRYDTRNLELYHLGLDIGESINRVEDEPEVTRRLYRALVNRLTQDHARLPIDPSTYFTE